MQFIPAKWFHEGRLKPIRLIVVHETISPEMGSGAEAVARFFAAGTRKGSTQRVSDSNSTVACVSDFDTCFGAAGANSDGLHIELVGPGNQSENDWHDPFSTATVIEAGKSIREWSTEFHVPLKWLTVAQVADGATRGLCTHDDVSHAFPAVSTGHSDPQNFPKAWALGLWTPPAPQEDDDVFEIINVSNGKSYLVGGPNIASLTADELKALRATKKYPERDMPLSVWNKAT